MTNTTTRGLSRRSLFAGVAALPALAGVAQIRASGGSSTTLSALSETVDVGDVFRIYAKPERFWLEFYGPWVLGRCHRLMLVGDGTDRPAGILPDAKSAPAEVPADLADDDRSAGWEG